MKRLSALLLLLALLFGTAACSSDSSSDSDVKTDEKDTEKDEDKDSDEVAFDDWVDEVNGFCADYDDEIASLDEPTDEDEVADYLAAGGEAFAAMIENIEGAGTPDENQEEVEEYLGLAKDAQDVIEEAIAAAEDGDLDEAEELFGEAEEIGDEAEPIAVTLGLDDCTDDADDEDATDDEDADDEDATDTTTGLDDLDDLGDLEDMSDVDTLVAVYEAAGFTTEEATCLAELIADGIADGTLDPESMDSMDESAMIELVTECVTMERLAEIGGGF